MKNADLEIIKEEQPLPLIYILIAIKFTIKGGEPVTGARAMSSATTRLIFSPTSIVHFHSNSKGKIHVI